MNRLQRLILARVFFFSVICGTSAYAGPNGGPLETTFANADIRITVGGKSVDEMKVCSIITIPAWWQGAIDIRQIRSAVEVSETEARCEFAHPCRRELTPAGDSDKYCPQGMTASVDDVSLVFLWLSDGGPVNVTRACKEGKVTVTPSGHRYCTLGRESAAEACAEHNRLVGEDPEEYFKLGAKCREKAKLEPWNEQYEGIIARCMGQCDNNAAESAEPSENTDSSTRW